MEGGGGESDGEGYRSCGEHTLEGGAEEGKDQPLEVDHSDSAEERFSSEVAGLGHVEVGDEVRDMPSTWGSVPFKIQSEDSHTTVIHSNCREEKLEQGR